METLVINTLDIDTCEDYLKVIPADKLGDYEVVNTADMNIKHCVGCNLCWLKTPGVCAIKDNYEQILRKIAHAQNLWIIADTHFGFLNYKAKRVMDRIVPLLTMYLTFKDGEMRHVLRYGALNIGVVYSGEGNQGLLDEWCQRVAINMYGVSLGAFRVKSVSEKKEQQEECNTCSPNTESQQQKAESQNHVVIINGSPRVRKHSNTDKIITSFTKGLEAEGTTFETYTLSSRQEWDAAQKAFTSNSRIIIALPLFVESAPSLLLEFLETLPIKEDTATMPPKELSFILQSGFAEGNQLRCGEHFLKTLPEKLGCTFGGCLLRGNNFGIRVLNEKQLAKVLKPYETMGQLYAKNGNFLTPEASRFVGLEHFPLLLRAIINVSFRLFEGKRWNKIAKSWGCTRPLDDKPYK